MAGCVAIQTIASVLGLDEKAVAALAEKGRWGKAGAGYLRFSMPKKLLDAIDAFEAVSGPNLPAIIAAAPAVPEKQKSNALAKADLLSAYTRTMQTAPRGAKERIRDEFMAAYNTGRLLPQVFTALGKVSWQTVETWKRTVKAKGDTFALAEKRGAWRRGQTKVSKEEEECLLACTLRQGDPPMSECLRAARGMMRARGIAAGMSDATYKRWLYEYRDKNYNVWVMARESEKALNDKVLMNLIRDWNLVEVGDVLIADGHRLNFEITNPATGKAKRMTLILWYDGKSAMPLGWEIMAEENTAAISSALRRAIRMLGKIPKVAYLDNGKAFGSKYFSGSPDLYECGITGLYERLGIHVTNAWKYHGQSKPVERFFRSFGEIERLAPTYSGTSIETKPARMHMGERLHREVWDKMMAGREVTPEDANAAVAWWFEQYAERIKKSGHLKGRAPLDVFLAGKGPGVDPAILRELMMAEKETPIRRSVITFQGKTYFNDKFFGRTDKLLIRYDLQDRRSILAYEQNGEFLCEAFEQEALHPAASVLGTESEKEAVSRWIEIKNGQMKETKKPFRAMLKNVVLPEIQRAAEFAGFGTHASPIPVADQKTLPLTPAEEDRLRAELLEAEALNQPEEQADFFAGIDSLSEADRYERILTAEFSGIEIPERLVLFARYFETTETYRTSAEYYEDFNIRLACGEEQAAAM